VYRLTTLLIALLALPTVASATESGQVAAVTAPAEEAAPTSDLAQSDATLEEPVEAAEEASNELELPVDLSLSFTTAFSLGSIIKPNRQTTDSVSGSLGFGVSRDVTDHFTAGLGMGVSLCLNSNCGVVRPGEARFRDMSLDLSYSNVWRIPKAAIGLSAGMSFTLPTSLSSRAANLYTAMSPSVSLSRSFGAFSLSYSFGFSKYFNRFPVIASDPNGRFERETLVREGGAENLSGNIVAEGAGYLTEWDTSHTLAARMGLKHVSLGLSFSFLDFYTYRYDSAEDIETADGLEVRDPLDSNESGSRRGHSQFMSGSFSVSYTLPVWEDRLSLSGRMTTSQQPKTADNRRVRFPFFDTQTSNLSNTSLAFTLAARY
jgi:hypothetical protein